MTPARDTEAAGRLVLQAKVARDLMVPNPMGIQADATVDEALALLTDKGFSALPVFADAGRPVGVLSRSDLLAHERETARNAAATTESPRPKEDQQRQGPSDKQEGGKEK